QRVTQERIIAQLSSFFGALALLLAAVGLYGVLAYAVERRTSEIGIRMAIGAKPASVVWLILRETLMRLAIGAMVGAAAAMALASFPALRAARIDPIVALRVE